MTRDQAFPSKWLKASDVPPTGIDVTIDNVTQEEVDYGDGPQMANNVKFHEFEKPLSLNGTNWDSIAAMHGPESDDWPNCKVRLYRTKTRNKSGATVDCVRIQPPVPTATPAAPAPAKPLTFVDKFAQNVIALGLPEKGPALTAKINETGSVLYDIDWPTKDGWRKATEEQLDGVLAALSAKDEDLL